jgi:multidrug resistance efflux pump
MRYEPYVSLFATGCRSRSHRKTPADRHNALADSNHNMEPQLSLITLRRESLPIPQLSKRQFQPRRGITKVRANLTKVRASLTKARASLPKVRANLTKVRANLPKACANLTKARANLPKARANLTKGWRRITKGCARIM